MTGVDTIVTKADIMEEEIAITETAEGQLTTIIPIILLVDIVVGALLHIHVVVVLLQGEGKYVFLLLNDSKFLTYKDSSNSVSKKYNSKIEQGQLRFNKAQS